MDSDALAWLRRAAEDRMTRLIAGGPPEGMDAEAWDTALALMRDASMLTDGATGLTLEELLGDDGDRVERP